MTEPGPVGAALVAFETVAVAAAADRVREAGQELAGPAGELLSALEEASAAAAGVTLGGDGGSAGVGGLLTAPALAECAALLARRVADTVAGSEEIARSMSRRAGLLAEADEEAAHHVTRAAG